QATGTGVGQDQRRDPFGVHGGEQESGRSSVVLGQHHCSLRPGGIQHSPHVVGPLFPGRHGRVGDGGGGSRTSPIEQDQSAKRGQPFHEGDPHRLFPSHIDVVKTRDVDHVRRPLSHDLVGDLGPAHLHVSGLRTFHSHQQSASSVDLSSG